MKILAFTDHHNSEKYFQAVKKKAENVDLIICCGDFTWFGRDIEKVLLQFNKLGKPVVVIPGNHEEGAPFEELCEELENIINAHSAIISTEHATIFGYGGGGFAKEDKVLENIVKKVKKQLPKQPLIMVTHAPPRNTNMDKVPHYGHVGNASINFAISYLKPKLLLCGHIHEGFQKKDKIDGTIILNPGPEGKIINLETL